MVELPAPPPEPELERVQALAEHLAPWWAEHAGEWGAKSGAVRYLFGVETPAGGTFWELTMQAIARIEAGEISTSTTPQAPSNSVEPWKTALPDW